MVSDVISACQSASGNVMAGSVFATTRMPERGHAKADSDEPQQAAQKQCCVVDSEEGSGRRRVTRVDEEEAESGRQRPSDAEDDCQAEPHAAARQTNAKTRQKRRKASRYRPHPYGKRQEMRFCPVAEPDLEGDQDHAESHKERRCPHEVLHQSASVNVT
jgi:hypothetical protein